MYQLHWVKGCPDMWSNIILSVSVGVFLDDVNIWTAGLTKADCPPQCGWVQFNWRPNRINRLNNRELLRPDCITWDNLGHFSLSLSVSLSLSLCLWPPAAQWNHLSFFSPPFSCITKEILHPSVSSCYCPFYGAKGLSPAFKVPPDVVPLHLARITGFSHIKAPT